MSKLKWIEPQSVSTSQEISTTFSSSFLLAEQLSKRGISSLSQANAFLKPDHYVQTSPLSFPEMGKTVERIQQAIQKKEKIGIWGDFDVDGQTSTALLVDSLRKAGAEVFFHIPNRAKESHGIRLDYFKEFLKKGIGLLITCDTGITEFESMEYAAGIGLDVIVSDHHTPQDRLPPAFTIVNPHQLEIGHPLSSLAGVGVAFQIIRALYAELGRPQDCDAYFDLVALGTIADLAELTQENRFYAQKGLAQMNSDLRLGLSSLLSCADFRDNTITESLVGFTIAPRLNAVGRLEDANQNVDFLLSTDPEFTARVANNLEDLNNQRKLAVDGVYHSALQILESEPALKKDPMLLLAKSGWEKGVVGIAASRLAEDFNKPVFLLDIQGDTASGSVRSVEGVDVIWAINENASFLNTFGGHPMAAGLSLNVDQLPAFRFALAKSIQNLSRGVPVEKELPIDCYLPLPNLSPSLLEEVDQLAPFGNGNPPPVLVSRNLEIIKQTTIGKTGSHRKLQVQDEQGEMRDVLWWNSGDKHPPQDKFDLAYYLRSNRFQGSLGIYLELIDFREQQPELVEIRPPLFTSDIQDCRTAMEALKIARDLLQLPDVCFWGEGSMEINGVPVKNRLQLIKSEMLAIVTAPPDMHTLREALKTVQPKKVYLFRLSKPDDSVQGFLKKLSGLVWYSIHHYQGKAGLNRLAAAMGQTVELIHIGLQWWQLHGDIDFSKLENDEIQIQKVDPPRPLQAEPLKQLSEVLASKLVEVISFRSFYSRADPAFLLRKQ